MKLALDVWYELWDKVGSEGETDPNHHPDEEDDFSQMHMLMPVPTPSTFWRKDIVDQTTRVDNEVALAWLENSLEYARCRGQARLAVLLASVRTEIMFEMQLV